MSKKAMLGGTFNPPHNAHIAMAKYALDRLGFDEVIVMPTATPPHKRAAEVDPKHRLEMARLAFLGIAKVTVSDLEQRRGGKSYTYDTVLEIGPISLLMGEDMFVTLEAWHRGDELVSSTEIIVFPRPGLRGGLMAEVGRLRQTYHAKVVVADMPMQADSSTEVRRCIAAGLRPDGVPEAVLDYIREKGLYVSG